MTSDRHPSTHLGAAAWVPNDDPTRPWADAIGLAAQWIWRRSEAEAAPPLLVTNAKNAARFGYTDFEDIIRAGGHATPQSRTIHDPGPVLAFAPTERSLHLAMNLARGHSLAIVEGSLLSLSEWAATANALNLLTGKVTASRITPEVRDDLESVIFYGGRNGWTNPDEKAHLRTHLAEHVSAGRITPDEAAAYVLSSPSVTDRGANRLRELLRQGEQGRRR
ncbi:hypothetical protein [Mycobacterium sp. 155]|uniref:hypothetical protein n=1 Tax=Mycobacterium sp. 155 TaxID=1157943 RepID=UPI00035D95CD|nr:hypothetical protein [Mycobacterium sp. 155]